MTKKGPLSKAETFYIDNNLKDGIDKLCVDLDRPKSTIEKYLKTTKQKKPETALFQQFARNNKGSTVMTQAASEMSDAKRKRGETNARQNCIVKIRD